MSTKVVATAAIRGINRKLMSSRAALTLVFIKNAEHFHHHTYYPSIHIFMRDNLIYTFHFYKNQIDSGSRESS